MEKKIVLLVLLIFLFLSCDFNPDKLGDIDTQTPTPALQITYTIELLQDENASQHPAEGTKLSLSNVLITAIANNKNFYVQDPAGGPNSGLFVTNGNDLFLEGLSIGNLITISGEYEEYFGMCSIALSDYSLVQSDYSDPVPVDVSVSDIASGGFLAESYESILVRISDITVTGIQLNNGSGTYTDFSVSGGLKISAKMFLLEPNVNDHFSYMTGVLVDSFSEQKLLPRSNSDIIN